MDLTCDKPGTATVCRLGGDLGCLSFGDLQTVLTGIEGNARVVFDLAGVPFVDAAGMMALLGAVRRVRRWGGDAVICAPHASANRALKAVLLPRVVTVTNDMAAARAYFHQPAAA